MTQEKKLVLRSFGSWETLTEQTPPSSKEDSGSDRSSSEPDAKSLSLEIHPLKESGIVISVTPPKAPSWGIKHIPCDIVLVIDISGSMQSPAPVPPTDDSQPEAEARLSVLDLVKHAARTIVETLDDTDRLGIVTYGDEAELVQPLVWMDKKNKQGTVSRIEKLHVKGLTNMWHGIKEGIRVFKDATVSSNVAAMMVLTDGMPNHMCPSKGYVPKLRTYGQLPASIHTFGFGYTIRSGLLKSIAEVGDGNYAFIPDSGMIGTVFVHAVANLQNTFATKASLEVVAPDGMQLSEACGGTVSPMGRINDEHRSWNSGETVISLGNLQYGQSRDIYLQYTNVDKARGVHGIQARLTYTEQEAGNASIEPRKVTASRSITDFTCKPDSWAIYHRTRASICHLLSTLFPIRAHDSEHVALADKALNHPKTALEKLIEECKALNLQDELNQSLLSDLCGPDPHGQISLALSKGEYWRRWGKHYLLSLWDAHSKQFCNTFKDPGPLMYGRNAPLFIKCRDELDAAFDNLPAPKPTRPPGTRGGWMGTPGPAGAGAGSYVAPRMNRWNRASNPCFAGTCFVEMGGGKAVRLDAVRRGMRLWTLAGPRAVAEIVKTEVQEAEMCVLGDCLVTPWHPVRDKAGGWMFPCDVAEKKTRYNGAIYSIMLQRDADELAHTVKVDGVVAVTLGHGVLAKSKKDARAHDFFGSYDEVQKSLERLPMDSNGVRFSSGVTKGFDGLANGFASAGDLCAPMREQTSTCLTSIRLG
jgi:Mg-chelatase subunit ChlD